MDNWLIIFIAALIGCIISLLFDNTIWVMDVIQLGLTIWALVILMRIETKLNWGNDEYED